MIGRRRKQRSDRGSRAAAGPGLASLVSVALLAPVDVAHGEDPAAAEPRECPVDGGAPEAEQPAEPVAVEGGGEAIDCDEANAEEESGKDEPPAGEPKPPPVEPPPDEIKVVPPRTEEKPDSDPGTGGGDGGSGGGGSGGGHGGDNGHGNDGGHATGERGGDGHRGQQATGRNGGDARSDERRNGTAAGGPVPAPVAVAPVADPLAIPSFLLPIYKEAERLYGIPWEVLAAVNQVETGFGSNLNVSSAGAVGWMQFLPSTWRTYGVDADGDGSRDPYDPHDAIFAAAAYLRAAGGGHDIRRALFAYNHADWYVDLVIALARQYEAGDFADPLPPARRLDRDFARKLLRIARENDVDWATMLAALRARGLTGRVPASGAELRELAAGLLRAERAGATRLRQLLGELVGTPQLTRDAVVLARFNHAVGIRGLVLGLQAVNEGLGRRVLDSRRISVYPGGAGDIEAGRVDSRVLVLLLYLAERHDGIDVTSLVSGHGFFARPGVASAHVYGQAVDISAIGGEPVLGNQKPGSPTHQALLDILALPNELRPAQAISLFELGGPSFAAADHHDHLHVGY